MRRGVVVMVCAMLVVSPRFVRADELLVFAAASLVDVLRELGASFQKTSHDTVTFNFGASSDLARQIADGAMPDAFFSADVAQMEKLEKGKLVDRAERRSVLSNTLAIVVPVAAKTAVTAVDDLKKVRTVAVAKPESVPAGVYARKYLQSLGLWEAVESKVVPTRDVRAALAAVEAEQADAGFVYTTDVTVSTKVRIAFWIPREQGPPIVYALAPLEGSRKPGTRTLVRYLASREAAATYKRYGFIVLPPE